jgi:hypothetical protein
MQIGLTIVFFACNEITSIVLYTIFVVQHPKTPTQEMFMEQKLLTCDSRHPFESGVFLAKKGVDLLHVVSDRELNLCRTRVNSGAGIPEWSLVNAVEREIHLRQMFRHENLLGILGKPLEETPFLTERNTSQKADMRKFQDLCYQLDGFFGGTLRTIWSLKHLTGINTPGLMPKFFHDMFLERQVGFRQSIINEGLTKSFPVETTPFTHVN